MLLIWGFKIRFKTTGEVVFFCPRCGGDRRGHELAARRWFTFFWIPIIPLKQLGTVVECETCHSRYEPSILERPTTAALGEVLTNAVHALTLMVVRTGDPTVPALRDHAIRDLRSTVAGYDPSAFDRDLGAVDPTLAEQYVAPLAAGLAVEGKERFLADLVRLAMAGGTLTTDQRLVLERAGRGLGLTPVHLTGIVTSVVAASTPQTQPPADGTAPGG